MRRTLFQKESAQSPGGASNGGEASPDRGASASSMEFMRQSQVPGHNAWVPDEQVKCCSICSKDFTTLNRKHHCRKCGQVWKKHQNISNFHKKYFCMSDSSFHFQKSLKFSNLIKLLQIAHCRWYVKSVVRRGWPFRTQTAPKLEYVRVLLERFNFQNLKNNKVFRFSNAVSLIFVLD